MPWCPKCSSEYRDEFTVCADCGSELIDQNPNPPSTSAPISPLNIRGVLILATITFLVPYIWILSATGFTEELTFIYLTLFVFGYALMHGWRNCRVVDGSLLVESLVVAAILHVTLWVILLLASIINLFRVVGTVPFIVMFSIVFLAVVWFGALLHRKILSLDS